MAETNAIPRKDLFTVSCYIFNVLVPRCFGFLPLRYDHDTERFNPSQLWLSVCYLSCFLIIGAFPFTAIAFSQIRTVREREVEGGFGRTMIYVHFTVLYVVLVCICVHQMFFSKYQMHLLNRCINFYRQCETLSEDNMDVSQFIYPLIFHGICSYIGFIILNYLALNFYFTYTSHVHLIHKIVHFVPNIVITTNAMSFHLKIISLTICGQRINRELRRCVESINVAHNEPPAGFEQACASAMERFDFLTIFHAEWYETCRMLERGTSLLMLFTVVNSFYNLTETVRWNNSHVRITRANSYFFLVCKALLRLRSLNDQQCDPTPLRYRGGPPRQLAFN